MVRLLIVVPKLVETSLVRGQDQLLKVLMGLQEMMLDGKYFGVVTSKLRVGHIIRQQQL